MTDTLQLPAPTWFVGCGNMGGAILDGWRLAGLDLGPVTVIRPSGKPVEGTRTVSKLRRGGPRRRSWWCSAFKPQKLDEVAPELRQRLSAKTVVVSMLAGVEVGEPEAALSGRRRDRSRDAQPAGRHPPRGDRPVTATMRTMRRARRSATSSPRSASRCG